MSTDIFDNRRETSNFSERLVEAFASDKPAEISKKLGITYQGAKNYLDGRIPAPDTLVEISRKTGYSIHWLLTGEGPKRTTLTTTESEVRPSPKELLESLNRATDLSPRLKLIFPGKTPAEIASDLGIPEPTVESYFEGHLPAGQELLRIHERTGVSLVWLLTNKGPQWAAPAAAPGGEIQGVSQENGSTSQPRNEAVAQSPERRVRAEDQLNRLDKAYVLLLIEQNHRIIQLLEQLVERSG